MYTKEEILKALHVIKDICDINPDCEGCPFGTKDGRCVLQESQPAKYNIADEEERWRAIRN